MKCVYVLIGTETYCGTDCPPTTFVDVYGSKSKAENDRVEFLAKRVEGIIRSASISTRKVI